MTPPISISKSDLMASVLFKKLKLTSKTFNDSILKVILHRFQIEKNALSDGELSTLKNDINEFKKKLKKVFDKHRHKYAFIRKHYKVSLSYEFLIFHTQIIRIKVLEKRKKCQIFF